MTVDSVKSVPDLQQLHQDLLEWLHSVSRVIENASTRIQENEAECQTFQQDIRKAAEQVENLELTTSIVAPMKAGKSTILNAIAGQDLLPNRATAMTTIPTEIVFDGNLEEPRLVLDSEFISIFEETIQQLNIRIQTIGQKEAINKTQEFPHLQNLLAQIQEQDHSFFTEKTSGREKIRQSLTDINDIVRLCNLISPSLNPLDRVSQIPRVETPFASVSNEKNGENANNYLGKLVLVDTPGPNEAGATKVNLYEIVKKQLRRSLAVLVVLDFTTLKTQAAEIIKQEVQEIGEYIGKENLYILVNKIDQRRENDPMNSESIQQLVQNEFGISVSGTMQRLFEISGRQAFCAIDFLREYQRHPSGTNLSKMNQLIVRSVAQEVFGIDWEEDLKTATPEQLQKKAKTLWERSGFQPFLKGVIDVLIAKAAPRSMKSATNSVENRLIEINDWCNLKLSTKKANAEQIRKTINDLEEQKEGFQTVREILEKLKEIVENQIKPDLEAKKESLRYKYESSSAVKDDLRKYFEEKWGIPLNSNFSSRDEAEVQLQRAKRCWESYQEKVYKDILFEFQETLNSYNNGFIEPKRKELKKWLNVSLTEQQTSVRDNLGVNLYWQPPELEVTFENLLSSEDTNIEAKITPWGWMHNIFSYPFQRFFDIPKVDEFYTLKLSKFNILSEQIKKGIDYLFNEMTEYLERLQNSFQEYENQVDRVLQTYIKSLKSSISSEHQSKEELEAIEQSLEVLLAVTEKYLEKAEAFRGQIEEFL